MTIIYMLAIRRVALALVVPDGALYCISDFKTNSQDSVLLHPCAADPVANKHAACPKATAEIKRNGAVPASGGITVRVDPQIDPRAPCPVFPCWINDDRPAGRRGAMSSFSER
jgi:hypothetical protein